MSQTIRLKRGRKSKVNKKVISSVQPILKENEISTSNHVYNSEDDTIDDSSYYSESTVNSDNEIHNMIHNIPFLDHEDDKIMGDDKNNGSSTTNFNRLSDVFNMTPSTRSKRIRKPKSNVHEDDSEYLTDDKEDVKQIIETTGGNINTLLDIIFLYKNETI